MYQGGTTVPTTELRCVGGSSKGEFSASSKGDSLEAEFANDFRRIVFETRLSFTPKAI
jgi:hypothetical protein